MVLNGQSCNKKQNESEIKSKTQRNGMNNLILNGNFNGFQIK